MEAHFRRPIDLVLRYGPGSCSDFDLDLIGFEPDRLEEILVSLRPSGLSDPDSVLDVPDQPVTGPGDVWVLGDHRVGCGDVFRRHPRAEGGGSRVSAYFSDQPPECGKRRLTQISLEGGVEWNSPARLR
jgi:hypothetical protein